MANMFFGNSLWQLVLQCDWVSKFILLFLLGLSIASWTVFLYKWILFRVKERQLKAAIARLKEVKTLEGLLPVVQEFADTIPGFFLSKNLAYLKTLLESNKEQAGVQLSVQKWEMLQYNMAQTIEIIIGNEESYLPLLSTSASVSPLLGLFGTVWGLVHAFIRISERQSADIATIAPGIAEALITTIAGIAVAVPALIMFNYLHARLRAIEKLSVSLAEKVSIVLQSLVVFN